MTYGTEDGVFDMTDYRNSKCRFVTEYANFKKDYYHHYAVIGIISLKTAQDCEEKINGIVCNVRRGLITLDEGMKCIAEV